MPRWLRVARAMLGTGVTFGAGVGIVAGIVGAFGWLAGKITSVDLMQIVGRFTVVSFLLGVAFSGVLALTARGRPFNRLSLRLVGGLGAGAGLLYFGFLAMNGGRNWSPRDAVANFAVLIVMGAGAAAATLLIARRAKSVLDSGDELAGLSAGNDEISRACRGTKVEVPGASR